MGFKNDFMWGAASAAYQLEGGYLDDGKGLGIWDALSEGHIAYGDNGNVSTDHYHKYKEDVALMKQLGLKAYRFSVSWPRVIPQEGVVNEKGLQFYLNLIDELKAAGIEPMVTVFHWNLPMWAHEKGGWKWDGIADAFADYTKVLAEAFRGKVRWWMTINEPACFGGLGYERGEHAPYEKNTPEVCAKVYRNILLSHGKCAQVLRQYAGEDLKIGMALCGNIYQPDTDAAEDVEAAYRRTFESFENGPFSYGLWGEAACGGKIPEMLKDEVSEEDMKTIFQPLDFFGFNIYNVVVKEYPGIPRTMMDWPITPDAIYWAVKFFEKRYGLPIVVTENGMANSDLVTPDGKVHDPQRIEYLRSYLRGMKRAVEEGVNVIGYMYWSIMDNLEWSFGYTRRFGIIWVDYRTLERIPKDSAYYYADIIRTNGADL